MRIALVAKTTKQSFVSQSAPEAELVSNQKAARSTSMPALSIWDLALGREGGSDFMEDNDATIVIV